MRLRLVRHNRVGLAVFDAVIFLCTSFVCCTAAPICGYKVVAKYPHVTASYTEGFFYLNGLFYESTGLEGHSAVMAIRPETGKPLQEFKLAPNLFGEGIVDWGPNILGWTWQSHAGFVYDRFHFAWLVNSSTTAKAGA